jgi:L-fuculose-phosphate aldolase
MDYQSEREQLCEIGRRVYARQFAAANEGNLSIRLEENLVLCTPTLFCKGYMEPDDLCLVDMSGEQLAGKRKRTSEVLLHLEIYRQREDVKSVVHCHPPHATAFAVAREPVPVGVLPEPDIFLGEVPISPYETPGTQSFADTVLPFVERTNTIILANHGTVSYERNCETAFWLTEVLDAYCRILILANQLGGIRRVSREKAHELLELRKVWGFEDERFAQEFAGMDLRDHPLFRETWTQSGVEQSAFPPEA